LIPTGPLIGILLVATPLLGLGAVDARAPLLGVGIMLGALLVALADNLISRRTTPLELQRRAPEVLSLGAANRIEVRVRNRCPRAVILLVRDDPPPEFITPDRGGRLRLAAHQERRVAYPTTPHQRGDFRFGDLHLRALSRLRLSWWQRRVPAAETIRVYPNLQDVSRWEALARRGRLQDLGVRSRLRGEGTEFESLREYVPDDCFRHVDWKATAKRGQPITRQFQTERNQILLIMLDCGRMMAAPPGEDRAALTRLDLSVNAALMLAHVAATLGDWVGMLTFADRIKRFVPPGRGRDQTRRLLEELYSLQAEMVEPDYRAATTYLRSRSRKRALVAAFTDLVDAEVSGQVLAYLAALAPHHLPMVVTIRDESLEALAAQEPSAPLDVYEKAIAVRALADRALALAKLRQRGAYICDARPEDLTAVAINQYLIIKRRGVL